MHIFYAQCPIFSAPDFLHLYFFCILPYSYSNNYGLRQSSINFIQVIWFFLCPLLNPPAILLDNFSYKLLMVVSFVRIIYGNFYNTILTSLLAAIQKSTPPKLLRLTRTKKQSSNTLLHKMIGSLNNLTLNLDCNTGQKKDCIKGMLERCKLLILRESISTIIWEDFENS